MEIGDRMKLYEGIASSTLIPNLPIVVRIDGRAFHTFTKGMAKPFDLNLVKTMDQLTLMLCEESNAKIGYTQSDEISLVIHESSPLTCVYFDRNVQKIVSVLSSFSTLNFNLLAKENGCIGTGPAMFDCRVFNLPSKEEVTNYLLWRELDATRNSIQSIARSLYTHKECENKKFNDLNEMLMQKGINFNNYDPRLKRGKYFIRDYRLEKFVNKLTGKENTKSKRYYDDSVFMPLNQYSNEERIQLFFEA